MGLIPFAMQDEFCLHFLLKDIGICYKIAVNPSDDVVSPAQIDWDRLHAGYVRGDDAQAERLFRHIIDYALPRIIRKLDPKADPDMVDELISGINFKLHGQGRLRQYKGPDSFLGWLRQIVVRERIDFFRERARRNDPIAGSFDNPVRDSWVVDGTVAAPSTIAHPRVAAERAELLAQFHACLAKMTAKDRELLTQRFLHGAEYADLADLL